MVTAGGEGNQTTEVKREFTQKGLVDEHIQMYHFCAGVSAGQRNSNSYTIALNSITFFILIIQFIEIVHI